MLKKILITGFALLFQFTYTLWNKTDSAENSSNWTPLGVLGLNISQIAFHNWTQGGDNSIAWTFIGNFGLDYNSTSWSFNNKLKIAFGMNKLGDNPFRTTDNELFLENVLIRKLGWFADPYFSNIVRTIIANGYNYKTTPETQIAGFFDPGYISQSIGFAYSIEKLFRFRLGIGFQETFTNKFRHYTDDTQTPDKLEAFKFDTGIESVSELDLPIDENLFYQSKIRLFSRFKSLDVWDVRWDNLITAKINKYLNVNLNVLVIYEKQQSLKTQIKESLQLGITYNLF
ncbi:MAG: DUF3078 domain-containing protein [Ignavibacteria bacterium]|nr:DUF3078 domain-containing protein [Ignavibacteria bacterium]